MIEIVRGFGARRRRGAQLGIAAAMALVLTACSADKNASEMTSFSAKESKGQTPGLFTIPADQIVKAIGQVKPTLASLWKLNTDKGFIQVNEAFETNVAGIYAGGDCIRARGAASTVMAVQDGKLAARAIQERLAAHG